MNKKSKEAFLAAPDAPRGGAAVAGKRREKKSRV